MRTIKKKNSSFSCQRLVIRHVKVNTEVACTIFFNIQAAIRIRNAQNFYKLTKRIVAKCLKFDEKRIGGDIFGLPSVMRSRVHVNHDPNIVGAMKLCNVSILDRKRIRKMTLEKIFISLRWFVSGT
jgi:hypothetical protein